jgi:hypothetical protein
LENRADGTPQLLVDVLRKRLFDLAFDNRLVGGDEPGPVIGGEFGIEAKAVIVLELAKCIFEEMVFDAQDDIGIMWMKQR